MFEAQSNSKFQGTTQVMYFLQARSGYVSKQLKIGRDRIGRIYHVRLRRAVLTTFCFEVTFQILTR